MRRRHHTLIPIFVLALVTAACGGGDGGGVTVGDGDPTTTTTTASSAEPATQECTTDAFSLRYPSEWHVAEEGGCEWFHPESFELPEDTEATSVAIHLQHPLDVPFDEIVDDLTSGPAVAEVLVDERLTLAGRDAAKVETVASGEALYPEGTRVYSYVVADVRSGLVLATTTSVADGDYDENQGVLDEMASSLTTG